MYRIINISKGGDVGSNTAAPTVESVLRSLELAVGEAERDGWACVGGIQYVVRTTVGSHHFAMQAMTKPGDLDPQNEMVKSGENELPDDGQTNDSTPIVVSPEIGTWKTETPDVSKLLMAGTSAALPVAMQRQIQGDGGEPSEGEIRIPEDLANPAFDKAVLAGEPIMGAKIPVASPHESIKQNKQRNKLAAAVQTVVKTQTQED